MTYTQRSFRSLIREDEREGVEQSIWQQIGTGQCNDYVHFYLKRKMVPILRCLTMAELWRAVITEKCFMY